MALWQELRNEPGIAACLAGLGVAFAGRAVEGDGAVLARAAQVLGAAAGLLARLAAVLEPDEHLAYERAGAALRAALGEEEFARLRAEGQAMPLAEAIDYALARAPGLTPSE